MRSHGEQGSHTIGSSLISAIPFAVSGFAAHAVNGRARQLVSTKHAQDTSDAAAGPTNIDEANLVICITYAAFRLLPYIPRRETFDLLVDDIFNADSYFEPCIPHYHRLLTEHLEVGEVKYNPKLYKVKTKESMAAIVNYQQDDISDVFLNVLRMLDRGDDVWVSAEHWDKIVVHGSITDDKDAGDTFLWNCRN